MDEVGKFREEERDSKDEQGGLKGWGCRTRQSEASGRAARRSVNLFHRTGTGLITRDGLTMPRCFQLNLISILVLALSR
jgi:hypothetical protein